MYRCQRKTGEIGSGTDHHYEITSVGVQVLLVLFSTMYFGDEVGWMNGLGIFIVIVGSFRFRIQV